MKFERRNRAGQTVVATDTVSGLQGALVLSRALQDPGLFRESLTRLEVHVVGTV
jgi:hypothetical protein